MNNEATLTELERLVLFSHHEIPLIPTGSSLVVGISGGADSMALALVFVHLRHHLSIRLCLAHYNHNLRVSSSRDERLVRAFAKRHHVEIYVEKRKERSLLSEDQARTLRHAFYSRALKFFKTKNLLLAHTQNDQAETVLMRIIRGSGLSGLKAMQPVTQLKDMCVIRPFLSVNRRQIELYLKQQKQPFGQDETNKDTTFLRNKIRHVLLPLLAKEFNPSIGSALSDLSLSAGDDYAFLLSKTQELFNKNVVVLKRAVKIKVDFLLKCHPAQRRLLLRLCFERVRGDLNLLTMRHIVQAENLLKVDTPKGSAFWPCGIKVEILKGELYICL